MDDIQTSPESPPPSNAEEPIVHKEVPNLLEHDSFHPNGPFDGIVAAHFPKDDKFVTSINSNWVPFLEFKIHDTFVREDGSYGADDFINTPQFLSPKHVHRACIPTKPTERDDPYFPYRSLWEPLPRDLLDPRSDETTRGISEAMVQITKDHLDLLQIAAEVMRFLSNDTKTFIDKHCMQDLPTLTYTIEPLLDKLNDCLVRLTTLAATERTTLYRYTEFRRAWLELAGQYNWYHGFRERVYNRELLLDATVQRVMGAFVGEDPAIIDRLRRAGMPVWCIQSYGSFSNQKIRELVNPTVSVVATIAECQPPVIIFKGDYLQNEDRMKAIRNEYYKRSATPDMYEQPKPPSRFPVSYQQSTQILPRMKPSLPSNRPSNLDRNEFVEPDSPIAPPAIPAWRNSFQDLDHLMPHTKTSATWQADRRYVVPKPQLFYRVSQEKQYRWLRIWAAIADAWIDAIANGLHNGRMLSSQEWRDLLSYDGRTSTDYVRTRTEDSLKAVLHELEIRLRLTRRPEPNWKGIAQAVKTEESRGKLVPEKVRWILWKLCEINFKYELLSIDRRLCQPAIRPRDMTDEEWMTNRESKVLRCFYGSTLGRVHIFTADPRLARKGLASPEWKERRPFVRALWSLMKDWDIEKPPALDISLEDWLKLKEEDFMATERSIVVFYCKTFYDSFCRLPTVPRTLLESDTSHF